MINRHLKVRTLGLLTATVVALAVVGCKSPESKVVGKWKDSKSNSLTFAADKTFTAMMGPQAASGKWSLKEKTVSVTFEQVGGKSVADEVKANEEKMAKMKLTADRVSQVREGIKSQISPSFTLSEDAKTLDLVLPKGVPATAKETFTKDDSK